jgi:hypothetical protein
VLHQHLPRVNSHASTLIHKTYRHNKRESERETASEREDLVEFCEVAVCVTEDDGIDADGGRVEVGHKAPPP